MNIAVGNCRNGLFAVRHIKHGVRFILMRKIFDLKAFIGAEHDPGDQMFLRHRVLRLTDFNRYLISVLLNHGHMFFRSAIRSARLHQFHIMAAADDGHIFIFYFRDDIFAGFAIIKFRFHNSTPLNFFIIFPEILLFNRNTAKITGKNSKKGRKCFMDNNALFKFTYGLYIITSEENKTDNGCVVNTAGQITDSPNRITVTINKNSKTHDMIKNTGVFNVSVLSEDADFELFRHFGFQSGCSTNKFKDFSDYKRAENGVSYIIRGTNAYISARVENEIDEETHTMFVALVEDARILSGTPSATYAYYHSHIKPKPQEKKTDKTVWRCKVCGYEYVGEELPKDFICPICKHPASDFEKIN